MKAEIKSLSAEQKELRNQRKESNIQGGRYISANEAAGRHRSNRYRLAHLYYAYAIVRNRVPVPFKDKVVNQKFVNRLIEFHETTVCS